MPERARLTADDVEKLHSPTPLGPQAGQVQFLGECLEGAGRLRFKPDRQQQMVQVSGKVKLLPAASQPDYAIPTPAKIAFASGAVRKRTNARPPSELEAGAAA